MSAINNALSQLANDQSKSAMTISKAEVKPIKQRPVLPWVVGSFALSLAVGGWALSQQQPQQLEPVSQLVVPDQSDVISPTTKVAVVDQPVYQVAQEESVADKARTIKTSPTRTENSQTSQPIVVAKVATKQPEVSNSSAVTQGEVVIEQVELTPKQLSAKAQASAKKALDSNQLAQALSYYSDALRYTPADKQVRKRVAALYYGKGEVRKAAEMLQKGIAIDADDYILRLSLARMLIKEKQNGVALTVLSALPAHAPVEYLSLRAVLAQKEQQDELALQSYQQLVELEPESGRWWMGLGIQQERAFNLPQAQTAYRQALTKLGLSSQSQQFIRDRLTLIESLQEQPSEN